MNQLHQKPSPSWAAIIIMFIIFWPVGMFLLFKRLSNDKQQAFKIHTSYGFGGWFMVFIAIILFAALSNNFVGFLFFLGGISIIYTSSTQRAKAKKYRAYIDLIVNHAEHNIVRIASILNMPYENVLSDLQAMMTAGILPNAYIDYERQEIWLQQKTEQPFVPENQQPRPSQTQFQQPHGNRKQVIVACKGCGANHVLYEGEVKYCDYCSSPLSS